MKVYFWGWLFISALFADDINSSDLRFFKSEIRRVIEKDQSDFHDMMNLELYFEEVLQEEEVSEEALKTLMNKMNQAKTFNNVFKLAGLQDLVEIKFFKEKLSADLLELNLRLSTKRGGLVFFSFKAKKVDGLIQIIDVMNYSTGAYMSEIMRPVYLAALTELDKNFLHRLLTRDKDLEKNIKALNRATKLIYAKKVKESLAELDKIKGKWRDSLCVCTSYITAYSIAEDYAKMEANLKRALGLYPDKSYLSFMMFEVYAAKNDYKSLIKLINRLQKTFTNDAALETWKAFSYYQVKKELKYFAHYIKKAKALDSKSKMPYHMEVMMYSTEGYEKELYVSLKKYLSLFKEGLPQVKTAADYAPFRKSKYYKAYLNLLKKVKA